MFRHDVYYVRPEDVQGEMLTLRQDEARHIVKVMRKTTNHLFSAVDGNGTSYDCELVQTKKDSLTARILKKSRLLGEPHFRLTLAVAVSKKEAFEWTLEKGTELGVAAFLPVVTARSVSVGMTVKERRCSRILIAAMKQCHRSSLPELLPAVSFPEACEQAAAFGIRLIAHEKGPNTGLNLPGQVNHRLNSGILFVGPEGGFSDEEIAEAKEMGIDVFSLGKRRLRSETAAIAATTLLLDRMGELN